MEFSILTLTVGTTDFVAFSVTTVLDNRATIPLLATKDGITLEYNDSVVFTFSLSFPGIIQVLKDAGEFLRDTATVNIIDVDCKRQMYIFSDVVNIQNHSNFCYRNSLWLILLHVYIFAEYILLHSVGDQF